MHADDIAHHLGRVVEEEAAAQEPGVVDDDVEQAEGIERLFDHGLGVAGIGDGKRVCDSLAPGIADFPDHRFGDAFVHAFAEQPAAEIVDHHFGAARRQFQRMRPAESAPRAGDKRDAAVEADLAGHC